MATAAIVISSDSSDNDDNDDKNTDDSSDTQQTTTRRRRGTRKRKQTEKASQATANSPKRAKKQLHQQLVVQTLPVQQHQPVAQQQRAAHDAAPVVRANSEGDVCSVCLDPPIHPVELDCRHKFCFICAKGMYAGGNQACSLCRAPIPQGFFERPELLQRTRSDLASSMVGVNNWQWFYQSRGGGWWKFEERNNQDIEDAFHAGQEQMDTLICGNMYTVDFVSLCQFNRDDATRKRRIKRDSVLAQSVGVAGMVLKLGE